MQADVDRIFSEQNLEFVDRSLISFRVADLRDLPVLSGEPPVPLSPVLIRDFRAVSDNERTSLVEAFYGRYGVAYFIVANAGAEPTFGHPLLDIAQQLSGEMPLLYPVSHPAEADPSAASLFGPPDGTLKVFQRPSQSTSLETSELHLHQDGLGSGGTISVVALYCESAPLWGGFTCFQNALRLTLELARNDAKAFYSLFSPTAVTVVKRRGPNALKVTGPVLYLDTYGAPQVFLRAMGGDYEMLWSQDESVTRAWEFLSQYLKPLAPGSSFVHFGDSGHGCFINNRVVLHGRTEFLDDQSRKRVLARKWFAVSAEDAEVKRVPGLRILKHYAVLRPDLFGPEMLEGTWVYDEHSGCNIRS